MMGLMPFRARGLVKFNRTVHRAMVGDGERGKFQLMRLSTSRSSRQAP